MYAYTTGNIIPSKYRVPIWMASAVLLGGSALFLARKKKETTKILYGLGGSLLGFFLSNLLINKN